MFSHLILHFPRTSFIPYATLTPFLHQPVSFSCPPFLHLSSITLLLPLCSLHLLLQTGGAKIVGAHNPTTRATYFDVSNLVLDTTKVHFLLNYYLYSYSCIILSSPF